MPDFYGADEPQPPPRRERASRANPGWGGYTSDPGTRGQAGWGNFAADQGPAPAPGFQQAQPQPQAQPQGQTQPPAHDDWSVDP